MFYIVFLLTMDAHGSHLEVFCRQCLPGKDLFAILFSWQLPNNLFLVANG